MRTATIIIGAGHAGLAMSRCLTSRSIDHVVLERGEVANSWRTERWDSLRLLTPNWQSRLPGYRYEGADPDGFRTMPETVRFIERYAAAVPPPIRTHTRVISVRATDAGYRVETDRGSWQTRTVVLANGACGIPGVPRLAEGVPPSIQQITPSNYRNPDQIDEGGVLVVGASASGAQIADELRRSGREVTIAVGEHVRVPRRYRGLDIQAWMDASGVLDERWHQVDDLARARRVPSLQLAGYPDHRTIDLNSLRALGVGVVGRLAGIRDGRALLSGSLPNVCALADLKMDRLLDRIDGWIDAAGIGSTTHPPHRFQPTQVDAAAPLELSLTDGRIRTVVWATGYRPDYSWLDVPVLDRKGHLRHDGGVVDAPGMYAMGLSFMRTRKSSLIDGAAPDARDLAEHLAAFLGGGGRRPIAPEAEPEQGPGRFSHERIAAAV